MSRVLLIAGSSGVHAEVRKRAWVREKILELSRTLSVEDLIVLDPTFRGAVFWAYRAMGPRVDALHPDGSVHSHFAGGVSVGRWAGVEPLAGIIDRAERRRPTGVTAFVVDDGGEHPELRAFTQRCADRGWRVERFVLGSLG